MKILLKIAYLGTRYCGYQVQPNGVSVQQKLNEAAEALFGFPCDIVGCSRTDSGVHANAFCATVSARGTDELSTGIPIERVPQAFSAHLPEDIRVYDACLVPGSFHARYDVLEKEYLYRIWNRRVMSPFEEGRAYHLPQEVTDDDLKRVQLAASHLIGMHDFTAFMAQGSDVVNPVRTVSFADFQRDGDRLLFRIRADGFLYNMVRIIVGTLIEVALGKTDPTSIPGILESKDRSRAGFTAPAQGLYLDRVFYNGIRF